MAPERRDAGGGPLAEKVLDDARREAAAIVLAARERAERRLREAEQEAGRIEAEVTAAGRAEGERKARREAALADIEARRMLLGARVSQVERILAEARRRLAERVEGPEGSRFLAALVAAGGRSLGVERFRVRVPGRFRAPLEDVLQGAGAVPVLEETEDARAGVTIHSLDGRKMVDMTVDGISRRRAQEAWRAAAEALFQREPGS
jgi:vacuolar-type H+-ATPase subunit E/Vma4